MTVPNRNIFTSPKGTARLRAIRNAALNAISNENIKPSKWFIIDSITLHFFEDCCLVTADFERGCLSRSDYENEPFHKSFKVYSRDLVSWHEYKDQFEPKEGYHRGVQYKPHNEPFPSKIW